MIINGFKVDPKSSQQSRPSLFTAANSSSTLCNLLEKLVGLLVPSPQFCVLEKLAGLLVPSLTLLLVHFTLTSAVQLEKDSCFLVPDVVSHDLHTAWLLFPWLLLHPDPHSAFSGVSSMCCNS